MALVACKKCGKEIGSNDIFCRNCGASTTFLANNAAIEPKKFSAITWFFISLLVGFFALAFIINSGETEKKAVAQQHEEAAKQVACVSDLQCAGDKNQGAAEGECRELLNERAKAVAKWDFKLGDGGMFDFLLSSFRWGNADKNQIIYLGDKAKFQNGFGAWQRFSYECLFDIHSQKAIDVSFKALN